MARRRSKAKAGTFSTAPKPPIKKPAIEQPAIEQIARLLVGSSYRVPVEGKSSKPGVQASEVAAAVGYMENRLEKRVTLAVATRAEPREISRLVQDAYRKVIRAVMQQRPQPLDLHQGADRWRLRMVTYDAAFELVWPERRKPFLKLAYEAKMRKREYIRVHRCATAALQEALANGSRDFRRRLYG